MVEFFFEKNHSLELQNLIISGHQKDNRVFLIFSKLHRQHWFRGL